uniref:Endonuclease/exonuclease/phosphatase domain-containing protein n=1 Tax=Micrurus lemniscatus lemniscatus TaxID=129467 RepID=A0A2D4IAJ4_MICLE
MQEETKILSLNINGLNSPQKRKKSFNKLNRMNLDIIAIHMVHVKEQHKHLLNYPKLGNRFASLSQYKKRVVVLYTKESIVAKQIYKDNEGRILIVKATLNQKRVVLVGIYAPNGGLEQFYRKLHNIIREIECDNICIMGDFNTITDKN